MAVDPTALHTNQRLLVQELILRGARVEPTSSCPETFVVSHGGREDVLWDRFSSVVPYSGTKVSADKDMAKELLRRRGVPVPDGVLLQPGDAEGALAAAARIGFPLVLKPNWGSHGEGVVCGIADPHSLELAVMRHAATSSEPFIMERQVAGEEHRVLAFSTGAFAAVKRERASVTGDGTSDISALASMENARRQAVRDEGPTSLCPVDLDAEALRHLRSSGFTDGFGHVPTRGERVFLRGQSNLARGGRAVDITDSVHPGIVSVAQRAREALFLPVAGVDIVCEDPFSDPDGQDCAVIEVNSNPGLAMHAFPGSGTPRPVASLLADVLFPWIPKRNGRR